MKKLLTYGVLLLLIVLLAGYFTTQFFLGGIVKTAVNKFGPDITQTKVELQAASLSPLSGQGTLTGLTVGNPKGWSQPNAFHLGKVHINLEPFSVLKDHIVINEILIEQPEFTYETKLVAHNIGDLLKNIEQSVGGKGGASDPKTKDGKPIKMVVKKLMIREGKVTVAVTGAGGITLPLPAIELTDIGTAEGGITPAQVAYAMMRAVTPAIVSASTKAIGKLGGTSGAAASEGVKQVGNAIKGLFDSARKTAPAPETKK